MKPTFVRIAIVSWLVLGCGINHAWSQEPPKTSTVKIKFKAFDSNHPDERLNPADYASNIVRDPLTLKPQFLERVKISRPSKDAFDELEVSKGWLIEQLVIPIVHPTEDYNPAILTKVVSNAEMTIYPGASRSTDQFALNAYIAQMNAYKALLGQLLEEVEESGQFNREAVRRNLRDAFQRKLTNMSDLKARLKEPTPENIAAAAKVRDETLRLYGLTVPEQPQVMCPCVPYCQWIGRCSFFGRRR